MNRKKRELELAHGFDQARTVSSTDAADEAYLADLRAMRKGVEAVAGDGEIPEAQFPAFLDGVEARIQSRRSGRWTGLWALASVTAAALIVAASLFVMFDSGPAGVTATVVEGATTDLEGASVEWSYSEAGDATVWVETDDGDLW